MQRSRNRHKTSLRYQDVPDGPWIEPYGGKDKRIIRRIERAKRRAQTQKEVTESR